MAEAPCAWHTHSHVVLFFALSSRPDAAQGVPRVLEWSICNFSGGQLKSHHLLLCHHVLIYYRLCRIAANDFKLPLWNHMQEVQQVPACSAEHPCISLTDATPRFCR